MLATPGASEVDQSASLTGMCDANQCPCEGFGNYCILHKGWCVVFSLAWMCVCFIAIMLFIFRNKNQTGFEVGFFILFSIAILLCFAICWFQNGKYGTTTGRHVVVTYYNRYSERVTGEHQYQESSPWGAIIGCGTCCVCLIMVMLCIAAYFMANPTATSPPPITRPPPVNRSWPTGLWCANTSTFSDPFTCNQSLCCCPTMVQNFPSSNQCDNGCNVTIIITGIGNCPAGNVTTLSFFGIPGGAVNTFSYNSFSCKIATYNPQSAQAAFISCLQQVAPCPGLDVSFSNSTTGTSCP